MVDVNGLGRTPFWTLFPDDGHLLLLIGVIVGNRNQLPELLVNAPGRGGKAFWLWSLTSASRNVIAEPSGARTSP